MFCRFTGFFVDYLAQREPYHEEARKLMFLGYVKEVELWIGASQMTDLFYILTEGGKSCYAQDAKQSLKKLREFVRVGSLSEGDIDMLLNSTWKDLEDSVVHHTTQRIRADFIISRDKKGFEKSSIPVKTPSDFFLFLKDQKGLDYEEVFFGSA